MVWAAWLIVKLGIADESVYVKLDIVAESVYVIKYWSLVLVSGVQVEQLFGVPCLVNGTIDAISNAVVIIVQEWGGLKVRLRPCASTPLLPLQVN